jgi:enterochelin esterase-like enzyme
VSLTGTPLQVLLITATLVAIVGAIWLTPHVKHSVSRFGLLVPGQILGMLALLAVGNAYFDFYNSWGDLTGQSGPAVHVSRPTSGAPAGLPPQVTTVRDSFITDHPMAKADGRLESVVIRGARSGVKTPAYVYLPPGYGSDATKRYPVLVALTGYPGNAQNEITQMRLPQEAAAEMSAGKIKPMIIVMLRPMVNPPRDTECTDVPGAGQPKADTFFGIDLPAALKTTYRTAETAGGWSIMGDSTGGYCALKVTLRHSDRYASAISLAGYYHSLSDITTGDLYDGSKALRDDNDLLYRLQHMPAPPVNLLLTSSKVGERAYKDTLKMAKIAKPPTQVSTLILDSGGHHFSVWRQELPGALEWLSSHLTSS